ncbi:MAG: N-acetylmuramoyl-L-alanine amidase [Chitinophagaceae bacterium]|nr:N-acetylmuramoyl-L-alanine amidase [Chitinophagaceae bacterium]
MKYCIPAISLFLSFPSLWAQQHDGSILKGHTTGPLPYLEYGLGEDRLGGAKMTFLDTNIVVKVVDSINNRYKIELTKNHYAYLPKENFAADSSIPAHSFYLTDNWKVSGDDKFDYVTIGLNGKLPYRSVQEINPSRIVVDIFGATSNTNWINLLSTAKEIKNAYYQQVEDDVFRIIIELKHPQHWGYTIFYDGNKLIIRVKRQPKILSLSKLKIAIDPGHGGDNIGETGRKSGIEEKNYTLKIANELQETLKNENASVFMTREKDTSISMIERIMMLRAQDPDFLISIHLNSSDIDTVRGASTYYRYIGFRPLSQFILKRLKEMKLEEFGNIGNFNFGLNGPTDYPNCLVEVAFLSNRSDEKKILDPGFRKVVAVKIAAGIKDWLRSLQ